MPSTMTRTNLREEIRELLGEPGVEKTWSNAQLNRFINSALRDLSMYGAFYGTVVAQGDGTAVVALPDEILRLTLVTIGDYEYRPIGPGYAVWCQDWDYTVLVDRDQAHPENTTLTFRSLITTGTDVNCIGNLWHEMIDPTDTSEDATVLTADDRFQTAIVNYVLSRALRGTEDDYKRFYEDYIMELKQFGLGAKLLRPAQYIHVEKQYHNRYSY